MELFKNVIVNIDKGNFTLQQLVSILTLIEDRIEIDTISGMARKENKTPRGIKISNQYKKINIGSQIMTIKGLKNIL